MSATAAHGDENLEVVPLRHYGRWLGVFFVALAVAMVVHTLWSKLPDPTGRTVCRTVDGVKSCHPALVWRFGWDVVHQYFFSHLIFAGLWLTLQITFFSMLIGIALGIVVAVMRLSPNRVLSGTAWTYTWFLRGTPVIVQLFFWYFLHLLYPQLSLGIPFFHVTFLNINTSSVFSALNAAILGLGLNEAAYMSEIVRSGLISVDEGQIEAATSIGMTRSQTMRMVILPQAMRVIIPPTGNEVISMLKTSSLASFVTVQELFFVQGEISGANLEIMQLLIVASLWYILVTTVLSVGQFYVERHYAKGALRTLPPTPTQRIRHDVKGVWDKARARRGAALS